MEHAERAENSRVVESRRMREVGYGRAGSDRGAELLVLDKYKDFNMGSLRTGQSKTFNTGSAYV